MSATIKTADELHAAIMNIPGIPERRDAAFVLGYKDGHRDARHAAAELVLASLAAEQAEGEIIQNVMFEVFQYAKISDGIDSADGVTRQRRREAMFQQDRKLRGMLAALSAAPSQPVGSALTAAQQLDLSTAAFCVAAVGDPACKLKPEDADRIIELLDSIRLAALTPEPAALPTEVVKEPAPPNSLPDWSECSLRVANSDFIAKRVAEGGYGAEPDTKLATELHRFIYEYDDADSYRSAWFLHRLEKVLNEVATPIAAQPAAAEPVRATIHETPYSRQLAQERAKDNK